MTTYTLALRIPGKPSTFGGYTLTVQYPSGPRLMIVMPVWSHSSGRWVEPGELAQVKDEFGDWRDRDAETFLGRQYGGGDGYVSLGPDGVRVTCWQVVRSVDPA